MAKSSKASSKAAPKAEIELPLANPYLAAGLAWLVPGLGHAYLRRRGRGFIFFGVVVSALLIGVAIQGELPWYFSSSPLATLATLGALGSGLPCLILRLAFDYTGDMTAAGFEYGRAFIIGAGIMNLLLVLDAWDICWGKELPRARPVAADDFSGGDDVEDSDAAAGPENPGQKGSGKKSAKKSARKSSKKRADQEAST